MVETLRVIAALFVAVETATIIVLHVLLPGYDPVRGPVSHYGVGPYRAFAPSSASRWWCSAAPGRAAHRPVYLMLICLGRSAVAFGIRIVRTPSFNCASTLWSSTLPGSRIS